MSLRSLTPQTAAFLIVDVQENLLKIMDPEITKEVVFNINLFSQMFRHWNAPVLATEQYPKGLGSTKSDIQSKIPELKPIEKMDFSCCLEEPFVKELEATGRKQIVVTGMEAHICVLQTVLDLLDRGYEVFLAMDGVQSSSKLKWKSGLNLMEKAGAVLATSETILFQMLGKAGTDDFKTFVRLLKEKD